MAKVQLPSSEQKPAIICDHGSCRAALPGRVKFCPYCGTAAKAEVPVVVSIRPPVVTAAATSSSSEPTATEAEPRVASQDEATPAAPTAASTKSGKTAPATVVQRAAIKPTTAAKKKGRLWPWVAGFVLVAWLVVGNLAGDEPTAQNPDADADAAAQFAAEALAQEHEEYMAAAKLEAEQVEAATVEADRLAAEQAEFIASRIEAAVDPVSKASNPPVYPAEAFLARAEGTVTLLVNVDALGRTTNITFETSSNSRALDRAAFDAVNSWQFIPATQGGEHVEGTVRVPVVFAIPVTPLVERQQVDQEPRERTRPDPGEAAEPMLQRARVAMDNRNFDTVIALAESVLQLDDNNREARRLIRDAEKERQQALDSTTIR